MSTRRNEPFVVKRGLQIAILSAGLLAAFWLGRERAPRLAEPEPRVNAQKGSNEQPPLSPEEENNARIYREISPSVVNITKKEIEYDFFLQPFLREGSGSGSVISKEGHILTNYHVVEGADRLEVALQEKTYPARLVGADPLSDLAVLQISSPP
ncbi:MAG: trypsin-like peptidase domain-containing protein, partial [Acidobacteria bacterium]|nr:trypsin-like peptidase domain-containing protein [Acidobacteriota bacterium]